MKLRDKKYLTSQELNYVLNTIRNNGDDEFSKEILKVALVGQIVIEDVDWDEVDKNGAPVYYDCNAIYDAIMGSDINLYEIRNYLDIDDILDKENSIEKVVANFLNGLDKKIDEYSKNLDLGQMKVLLEEFQGLQKEEKEE